VVHPQRFARPGFAVELSYPAVTPGGQAVERDETPFREHERVHLSSPDRRELYIELVRFGDLTPQDEYRDHSSYLGKRFGAEAISDLTETSLRERPAWRYGFRWDEGERAVLLIQVGRDTYRIIYDPRSELNSQVLDTVRIVE
jgi:hypothetical protein